MNLSEQNLSLPSDDETLWSLLNRPFVQKGAKHSNYDIEKCSICHEKITVENPLIDSHTVSESILARIANKERKVSFLDRKRSAATDFKDMRNSHIGSAGCRRFAHKDCDTTEFSAYENGDYSSSAGAISLIRKILHSNKSFQISHIGQGIGELKAAHEEFSRQLDSQQVLTNQALRFANHRNAFLSRELPHLFRLTTWIDDVSEENIVWSTLTFEKILPIASQGIIQVSESGQIVPTFFALLPISKEESIFFLGGLKTNYDTFKKVARIPLIASLYFTSSFPQAVFWPAGYRSSLIELLVAKHRILPPAFSNWSDTNALKRLIPPDLDIRAQDVLGKGIENH